MGADLESLEREIASMAIDRVTFTYTDGEKLEYARAIAGATRSDGRYLISYIIILAIIGGLVVLSFIHWAAGGSEGYGKIAFFIGLCIFCVPVVLWNRRKASLRRNYTSAYLNGAYRYFLLPGMIAAFADGRAAFLDLAGNTLIQTDNLLVVNGRRKGDTLIIPRRMDADGVWRKSIDAARNPDSASVNLSLTRPPVA